MAEALELYRVAANADKAFMRQNLKWLQKDGNEEIPTWDPRDMEMDEIPRGAFAPWRVKEGYKGVYSEELRGDDPALAPPSGTLLWLLPPPPLPLLSSRVVYV